MAGCADRWGFVRSPAIPDLESARPVAGRYDFSRLLDRRSCAPAAGLETVCTRKQSKLGSRRHPKGWTPNGYGTKNICHRVSGLDALGDSNRFHSYLGNPGGEKTIGRNFFSENSSCLSAQ